MSLATLAAAVKASGPSKLDLSAVRVGASSSFKSPVSASGFPSPAASTATHTAALTTGLAAKLQAALASPPTAPKAQPLPPPTPPGLSGPGVHVPKPPATPPPKRLETPPRQPTAQPPAAHDLPTPTRAARKYVAQGRPSADLPQQPPKQTGSGQGIGFSAQQAKDTFHTPPASPRHPVTPPRPAGAALKRSVSKIPKPPATFSPPATATRPANSQIPVPEAKHQLAPGSTAQPANNTAAVTPEPAGKQQGQTPWPPVAPSPAAAPASVSAQTSPTAAQPATTPNLPVPPGSSAQPSSMATTAGTESSTPTTPASTAMESISGQPAAPSTASPAAGKQGGIAAMLYGHSSNGALSGGALSSMPVVGPLNKNPRPSVSGSSKGLPALAGSLHSKSEGHLPSLLEASADASASPAQQESYSDDDDFSSDAESIDSLTSHVEKHSSNLPKTKLDLVMQIKQRPALSPFTGSGKTDPSVSGANRQPSRLPPAPVYSSSVPSLSGKLSQMLQSSSDEFKLPKLATRSSEPSRPESGRSRNTHYSQLSVDRSITYVKMSYDSKSGLPNLPSLKAVQPDMKRQWPALSPYKSTSSGGLPAEAGGFKAHVNMAMAVQRMAM